ncbi:hypothetical protein EVAR_46566_1 [Eumeta japonica]|uniref:Uncharacterized protein n=1 Tax=Eumeta variegata TaxID=151549 RepID=A0A4C1XQW9_EUMVA|nr:hypothetical protein EVAR_46566_1 [Eumeta japonica]
MTPSHAVTPPYRRRSLFPFVCVPRILYTSLLLRVSCIYLYKYEKNSSNIQGNIKLGVGVDTETRAEPGSGTKAVGDQRAGGDDN